MGGKKRFGRPIWGKRTNELAQDGGVAKAGDATPRELPTSLSLDSDDEAGQMIAVSRHADMNTGVHTHSHTHTTQKPEHTQNTTARQHQPSSSVPLQDTEALQSQLVSARTQTCCKRAHTRSHTLKHSHSRTPPQAIVFSGGIV